MTWPFRRALSAAASVLAAASATLLLAAAAHAAGPPAITDTWASGVTGSVADLHALVNAGGATTTYHFSYITDAAYQANLAAAPPRDGFTGAAKAPAGTDPSLFATSTDQPVLQHLTGLASNTTYRYRASAANSFGPITATAKSFTTRTPGGATLILPDNRVWEMVSPAQKNGGQILPPGALAGGGVFQSAADGNALTYSSPASFGPAESTSSFIDASADGSDVFFLTDVALSAQDTGLLDLYDARVGGGFPEPTPTAPCNGDECQGPAPAPEDPTPGTATLLGPPNPPVVFQKPPTKPNKPKKHHPKKHQKAKHRRAAHRDRARR